MDHVYFELNNLSKKYKTRLTSIDYTTILNICIYEKTFKKKIMNVQTTQHVVYIVQKQFEQHITTTKKYDKYLHVQKKF